MDHVIAVNLGGNTWANECYKCAEVLILPSLLIQTKSPKRLNAV